jgi:hypothetical protein
MLDDQDPRNREFRDPPLPSDLQPRDSSSMWGWIVGGVFLLLVIGLAIGIGRNETQVASNNSNSPPATTSTAPAAKPPAAPGPAAPAAPRQ